MLKKTYLVKHTKGAIGLRLFGLGPNLKPSNGLFKLKKFLDRNAFWAQNREISEIKKCLANSDVIVSIWCCNQIVGFGRALSDGIYRGVLWDVVIDQNYQGQGYGRLIIETLLSSKEIKNTKKIYLMTTNQKSFYSQLDFKEATSQSLLIRDM